MLKTVLWRIINFCLQIVFFVAMLAAVAAFLYRDLGRGPVDWPNLILVVKLELRSAVTIACEQDSVLSSTRSLYTYAYDRWFVPTYKEIQERWPTRRSAPFNTWMRFTDLPFYAHLIAFLALFSLPFFLWRLFVAYNRTKRPLRVFLSYNRSRLQSVHRLRNALIAGGIAPIVVEYKSKPHDALLDEISKKLNQSNMFVCLPGKKASFVEAEVLAATQRRMPIFFLLEDEDGSIPNTAHKTYPILLANVLEVTEYRSLVAFLKYLGGDPSTLLSVSGTTEKEKHEFLFHPGNFDYFRDTPLYLAALYLLMCAIMIAPFLFGFMFGVGGSALGACSMFSECAERFDSFNSRFDLLSSYFSPLILPAFVFMLPAGLFTGLLFRPLIAKAQTRNIARRLTADGQFAYPLFLKYLGQNSYWTDLLNAFSRKPPKAHHEVRPS